MAPDRQWLGADLGTGLRRKKNEPAAMPGVCRALAAALGVEPAAVAVATTANAKRFFGLPSGQRADDGSFSDYDAQGIWWSSTLSGSATNYWNYQLSSSDAAAERDEDGAPGSGLSVRCLQD